MTQTCSDCGQDHSDLPALWPVGAKIKTITSEIGYLRRDNHELDTIPLGTYGTIAYHTDDGRPLVDFGHYGAHSFHYPESALELVEIPLQAQYDTLLSRATRLEEQNAKYRQVLRVIRDAIATHQVYDKYTKSDIDRVLEEEPEACELCGGRIVEATGYKHCTQCGKVYW